MKINYDPAVLEQIATDKTNKSLRKAVLGLVSRQTETELETKRTVEKNGQGLYPRDVKFLTSVADSIKKNGRLPAGKRDLVLTRTLRYRRQLTEIFVGKVQLDLPVVKTQIQQPEQ